MTYWTAIKQAIESDTVDLKSISEQYGVALKQVGQDYRTMKTLIGA